MVFWCAKKSLRAIFQSWAIWWLMGPMLHKVAQFLGHGRLLNLFFGSSQTDVWLPRYGHSKFWGGVVHKNKVYIRFTCSCNKLCSNLVQTKMHGLHGERFHVTRTCPACMQQAVPDLTSPRVYLSPGGAGAHLSGLNKLFFGYSFSGESVLGPVLPRP